MAIVKGAGMIMKAIIEEGTAELALRMQELALSEGALPRHLHVAMFTQSIDTRMLTMRQLSRALVALWCTDNEVANDMLKRIVPSGLIINLQSTESVPKDRDLMNIRDNLTLAMEHNFDKAKGKTIQKQIMNSQSVKVIEKQLNNVLQHWKQRVNATKTDPADRVVVLRRRRQRIKSTENWDLFYYKFSLDHAVPNLIWNFKTREELREAIENEIRSFNIDKDLGQGHIISWNHLEFEVPYNCLQEEIRIGDYYLRILLECGSVSYDQIEISRPIEFFNDLYHRFLLTTKLNMKCMCLQAMTIVYTKCYETIGQFNDTKYIVAMLDKCADKMERDRLLLFIEALILNKSNVKEILDSNGVRIFVDLLTLAHLHTSRAYVPTQSNVIEASADMLARSESAEKEWYYGNKQGPYSFKELKELYSNGTIDTKTRCWAQGMDGWRQIDKIAQLKWTLLATSQQSLLNETQLAILILNILIKISEFYPSRDSENAIIRPLPRIKRMLSDQTCFPHVIQLLLTFDPIIVEKVSLLIYLIIQDNPILPRLYLTGMFFFILMYTGSNVLPIGRFLQYTHNKQAFRNLDDPQQQSQQTTSDIIQRSILGHLLPEAMICYLENHGYEKFSQIFLGEFDTPEAIWNNDMRRHMIEKIAGHLADFSPRLQSNTRALYQYCPIPIIAYPQLENELFCSIFYLKHLCDIRRFPNWPIGEPVQLLKDCLLTWKYEIEKKPPQMSRDQALEILDLPTDQGQTYDENKIRKAYFKLAQKYHPDKNPDGRDIFEKVNKAYEFLCSSSKLKTGPDTHNISLILRTQVILYERFADVLMPYKYAGYEMLIKTIRFETNDQQLFSKKPEEQLLNICAELVYQTIRCSALNAEELRRENGIEILNEAFNRCISVLNLYSKNESEISVSVCIYIAKCYFAAAQFEECREKFLQLETIIKDLCRCLNYKQLPRLCITVCETLGEFAKYDQQLQERMFKSGVLLHLLAYVFNYDYTLDEGGVERETETNQQETANNLARACLSTLINLCTTNQAIMQSLTSLLTPYLARNLTNTEFNCLKVLNSNSYSPYLIWDNKTRAELNAYLEEEREHLYKTGDCNDKEYGLKFHYSIFDDELIIGDIFIRVFNEQPTFQLENAKRFCIDLLDYLGSHAQYMYSMLAMCSTNNTAPLQVDERKLKNVESALEALRNCIRNNDGVESQCQTHFKLLFNLLRLVAYPRIQQLTLEILLSVTTNKDCINDIAQAEVLVYLLMVLYSLPSAQTTALECLYALSSNQKIIKDMIHTGGILYVLNIFANNNLSNVRQKSAELFAKLMTDKLTGPKVRLILQRFLPPLFMDAMKDNSEASVVTYEGTYENPELIWNEDTREKVSNTIRRMCTAHYEAQTKNIEHKWAVGEDLKGAGVDLASATSTLYSGGTQNELVVSGVFIRLFIANPGWVLRKPKEFLTDLFETWSEMCNRKLQEGEHLELLSQALVQLFTAQPVLLDLVPTMGSIPQVVQALNSKKDGIVGAGVQVLNQLVNNDSCLKTMCTTELMNPMKQAMQKRTDLISINADTLAKIFSSPTVVDEFVGQAVRCELIEYLLDLLQSNMDRVADKPASIKALIVKALKAMLNSIQYASKVR